jgi:hypothetical protein
MTDRVTAKAYLTSKFELSLWYGETQVGMVHDAFTSDATWYGTFECFVDPRASVVGDRLVSFIKFCQDWCARSKEDPQDPPDASEFDQFSDIIESGRWFAKTLAGEKLLIEKAPVFYADNEISW